MVAKFCSRSQGQPEPGVRSAAMISIRREISREGRICRLSRGFSSLLAVTADHLGYALNLGSSPAYTARRAERPFFKRRTSWARLELRAFWARWHFGQCVHGRPRPTGRVAIGPTAVVTESTLSFPRPR